MELQLYEVMDGLWTFPLEVSGNLLGSVNCFVVKGKDGGRNLLIDSGCDPSQVYDWCERVNIDAGLLGGTDHQTLMDVLHALDLTPENTDVFLTHLHTDHAGNAVKLFNMGYRIIMSRTAYEKEANKYPYDKQRMHSEGIREISPQMELLAYVISGNSCTVDAQLVDDGDILDYGRFHFECIASPGHTQGHMCLYDKASKTMILGDQILFDASTFITCIRGEEDCLGDYLSSLERLRGFDVVHAFSSHGVVSGDLHQRIDDVCSRHEERLNYLLGFICETPGLSGYQLAKKMSIPYNKKPWNEVSMVHSYFTVGKTFACLDYLVKQGKIIRRENNGIRTYDPS